MFRFLSFLIGIGGFVIQNAQASLQSEMQFQEGRQQYIKNCIKSGTFYKKSDQKSFFYTLVRLSNPKQVANMALLGAVFGPVLTQEEIDQLWILGIKHSAQMNPNAPNPVMDFRQIFALYVVGRMVGDTIWENYNMLDNKKPVSNGGPRLIPTQERMMSYIGKLRQELNHSKRRTTQPSERQAFPTLSQYQTFIDQILLSYEQTPQLIYNLLNAVDFESIAKAFDLSVASEFGMKWLRQYVEARPDAKKIIETRLLQLEPNALVLSGQRILAEDPSTAFPQAIAAYTLAATKDRSLQPKLGNFLQTLIQNKQVKAFEPLLARRVK